MTKEEKLKELKMELDKVESQNFYNKMVKIAQYIKRIYQTYTKA